MTTSPLKFAIKSIEISERPVSLRLPFKFGNTAVTHTAQAFARVVLETAGGQQAVGHSAQLMVPRWFNKAAHLSNDDTVDELRRTVQAATDVAGKLNADTIAGLARTCREECVSTSVTTGTPRLAAGFGPALIEMALIDAACVSSNLSIEAALNTDLFDLSAHCPADLNPDFFVTRARKARLPNEMFIRHTVGQDAPLLEDELGSNAPKDGLPIALETVISRQGIRYFKIKLNGDVEADVDRLTRLSAFLSDRCPGYRATLDANEQYAVDDFADFAERLLKDPALRGIAEAMLFIEQPFARETAMSDESVPALLKSLKIPVIIDESDDDDTALPQALGLGYSGTSVKSCKGIFRAFFNAARIEQARAQGVTAFLSAEDLTCQLGLCLQQDLAMAGLCGATHAEHNGHYFVAGMQGASASETADYLQQHGDLYEPFGPHGATLKIENGVVSLRSLRGPGFSTSVQPDLSNNKTLSVQGSNP